MLNQYMNKAMNIISAMSFEEKMLYMSICFSDSIMDKDAIMGIEKPDKDLPSQDEKIYYDEDDMYLESWATFANIDQEYNRLMADLKKKARMSDKHSKKNIHKDKSKAGYHNGARKQGFGSYDRFGKPKKLAKDTNKDLKAQLMELDELPDDITINEAVSFLNSIYDLFYFEGFQMDLVWFHKSEWYDRLEENISMVETIYQEYVGKLEEIQSDLYYSTETLFPEMGMSFQNRVVELYNFMVMEDLNHVKSRMIHWLICRYKDNREYEKWQEELRHKKEMCRLQRLMGEADSYLK